MFRMTLLLGPPGAGKTTLLLALAGKLDKSLRVSFLITLRRMFGVCNVHTLLEDKRSSNYSIRNMKDVRSFNCFPRLISSHYVSFASNLYLYIFHSFSIMWRLSNI